MSKILFVDVDGTLCGRQNKAPDSAVEAIRKARKNGHKVYICTGRSKAEVYDDIWEIGLDGMIGGNGSYVEDHGKVIMHQKLKLEEVQEIVKWFNEIGCEFYLEANSGLYPSKNYRDVTLEAYKKGGQYLNIDGVMKFLDGMTYGDDFDKDDVNKISYRLNSMEDYERTKDKFSYLKNGTWGVGGPMSHGDIGVAGIDKKHSVNVLLDYLEMKKEDAIAFGDEKVDIPMFEAVGYSVAMGSGSDECKAAADYITTDTDDDGLYNAFKYLGLID
jgi:hypothetical protein